MERNLLINPLANKATSNLRYRSITNMGLHVRATRFDAHGRGPKSVLTCWARYGVNDTRGGHVPIMAD